MVSKVGYQETPPQKLVLEFNMVQEGRGSLRSKSVKIGEVLCVLPVNYSILKVRRNLW